MKYFIQSTQHYMIRFVFPLLFLASQYIYQSYAVAASTSTSTSTSTKPSDDQAAIGTLHLDVHLTVGTRKEALANAPVYTKLSTDSDGILVLEPKDLAQPDIILKVTSVSEVQELKPLLHEGEKAPPAAKTVAPWYYIEVGDGGRIIYYLGSRQKDFLETLRSKIKIPSESLFSSTATGNKSTDGGDYYSNLLTSMFSHLVNRSDFKQIEDTIIKRALACVISALNYL